MNNAIICQHCGISTDAVNADHHCPNCAKAIAAFSPSTTQEVTTITRRALVITALVSLAPITVAARTTGDYGLPTPPKGCTIHTVYEDLSAVARCKNKKEAHYNPDTRTWKKGKRK